MAFNRAVGTSTICLYRHINITFIPTPLRRLIDLLSVGIKVILMCLSKQIVLYSPNSCNKRLGGVGIKVILMCLYKQIVLVSTILLNASEVWG
jgi:hypothetical protein